MPNVTVRHCLSRRIDLRELAFALQNAVAGALDCDDPGGHLYPDDVEVQFHEIMATDKTNYQLEIVVEANEFPARKANLKERAKKIAEAIAPIKESAGKIKAFVWVLLHPAAFRQDVTSAGLLF